MGVVKESTYYGVVELAHQDKEDMIVLSMGGRDGLTAEDIFGDFAGEYVKVTVKIIKEDSTEANVMKKCQNFLRDSSLAGVPV
jgi:hypothetical protein